MYKLKYGFQLVVSVLLLLAGLVIAVKGALLIAFFFAGLGAWLLFGAIEALWLSDEE